MTTGERHIPSVMPSVHAYYKRQGYESCPTCGEWLLDPPRGRKGIQEKGTSMGKHREFDPGDLTLDVEVLGQCDNCAEPITEDDDYFSDGYGMIHERCQPPKRTTPYANREVREWLREKLIPLIEGLRSADLPVQPEVHKELFDAEVEAKRLAYPGHK